MYFFKSVASNELRRMKNGFRDFELVTSDKDNATRNLFYLTDLGKRMRDVKYFREAIHERISCCEEGISNQRR